MNRRDAVSRPALSVHLQSVTDNRLRPAGLAMAIGSVLGLTSPAPLLAGEAGSSITTDGQTATTVTATNGIPSHWTVTTGTVKGRNGTQVGFNSFKDFGVEAGQTVDLILPTQVSNLVNLVHDSRSYINGTLNGKLADTGAVGGRVFFVDPRGLLVGKDGVINVGSLSVATPTRKAMGEILNADSALDGLLTGTLTPAQISDSGLVDIQGRINASNGVRVQARAIDVTGTIFVQQAANRLADSDLQRIDDAAVNTGNDAPLVLVNDGGKIQLRAAAISDTGLGVRSAEASVVVGGNAALTADDIELTATATVDSGYDKDAATFDELQADLLNSITDTGTLLDLGDALVNLGAEKVLGEQVSFLHGSTTARVEVKDNASLTARDDLTLHASTRQIIDNSAAGKEYEKGEVVKDADGNDLTNPDGSPLLKKHKLSLGAAYAQINATTEAIIRSGATVSAGGDVAVRADSETGLKLAAESFAVNNTAAAFTAAISNVNVDTRAVIEAGSTTLTAGSVDVSAYNTASLETSATARADKNGTVGLAGAVSLQDLSAEARLDRNVTTSTSGGHSGDVTVQAATVTSLNKTSTLITGPKSEPKPGEEEIKQVSEGSDGLMKMAQSLAGSGISSAISKLSSDEQETPAPTNPGTPPPASPFRLGGAISFVNGSHTANASIGAGTRITSAGNLVVDSQVIDAQIGNHAMSNVLAKGKSGDGSAFALSGAVNIAMLDHQANTVVGSNAQLSANNIGLASDVRLPRDFSALTNAVPDFSSFDAFKDSITAAKDLITDPSDLFASYAAARGSAEQVAIGGAVSWFRASNSARTDVASGAHLTTTSTATTPWTAALQGNDHAGDERTRSFAAATTVRANTDVTALHAAGDLALKNLKDSQVAQGGTALGGSVGYMDYRNTAAAIINDGAELDAGAGSIAVDASNKEFIVALALQSGQGGSIGVSGTASALDLDSHTLAGISNRAKLTADKVDLSANEDLFVWSVAGAVAMSDSISVGASVAYQQMDTDTRAFVGAVPDDFRSGSSSASGSINTNALSAKATSEGLAGAVAAAGAVAKSSSQQLQDQQKALADKENAANPGFLDGLKSRAMGKVTALEGMAKQADSEGSAGLTQYFDKAKGLLGKGENPPGQGAQAPQPKFGIALSGSATVNRARQNTKADISGATLAGLAGNAVKLDIAALNKTLLVSVSGALSVTAAGSDNTQGSASLAGGVAYGDIRNSTRAELLDSTVSNAGDVTVTARNESEQVNVGLSVGVNASSDQSTAAAGAISATVAISRNQTDARVQGSTISGTGGDIDVKAVNESKIANGGGAIYAGGKAGLGAAVTYAEIKDGTRAAISGGTISAVDDVRVRAADASQIVAAAASGGASARNDGVAAAGSVVVNRVANQTAASIDGGASISFGGDLEAFAGTASITDVSTTGSNCGSGFSVDYCATEIGAISVDANADTATTEDTQVDAAGRNNGRSAIIAVAGMAQVGGNNAGVAFAYNTIDNTHTVAVNDASLLGSSTSRIELTAADQADILAVSAGIGGSTGNFTGVGSASYNAIGNTTSVLVGRGLPDAQGVSAESGARLDAASIRLDASDKAFIGSLAGAATLGSKVAVGAALTVNEIDNSTLALATGADLSAHDGGVSLDAANQARILSGAVAVGAANNVAIQGSASWSSISNRAQASLLGGSLSADALQVGADNASKVYTLTGAVAGSGTAAIGAAVNIANIADHTIAEVDGTALQVSGDLDVNAASSATTKTLAIAGALAGTASIAGSNSTNLLDNRTEARLHNTRLQGTGVTGDVTVSADTSGAAYSLGGALAVGGSAGVGVGSSVNDIRGSTLASVDNAALHAANSLSVDAANRSLVRTAAVAGAGAGSAAVAGSVTTNLVSSTTLAELVDSRIDNELADVTVSARDERSIDSLAGSAAVAGSVGVGAAVAYNDIGGSTSAVVRGSALDLDVRNLLVSADASGAAGGNGNRIRTIAAGLGGGAAVGGAASVAVNRMQGKVSARIEDRADVLAQDNVGVLAAQAQKIDVYAGSVGGGATAGVGLGTVVNLVNGSTEALISGASTRVSALGNGDALSGVNDGRRTSGNAHSNRTDASGLDFTDVDLGTGRIAVSGLVVNAATRQQVNTVGFSGAVGTTPIASGSVAVMAAVNQIAGSTTAAITDAKINQHGAGAAAGQDDGVDTVAGEAQSVDVRASHHVASTSYVSGLAASAGVFSGAGALSTNLFDSAATARIDGATVNAADAVVVEANGSQNALAIVVGAAAGLTGGAATGVVNDFSTRTEARLIGGKVGAGELQVTANSDNAASLVGGAGSLGAGAAVAGTALVNIGRATTLARLGSNVTATDVAVSGEVAVNALSRSDFNGLAVSGAAAGGAGIAGMAQLHLLQSDTRALLQNTTVSSSDLVVNAEDVLRLSAWSGALGVGLMGTGVGAGASVAILGSNVRAEVENSDINADGSIAVSAGSDRQVDMVTATAGVGATTGIGGAASLLLAGIGSTGDSSSELGGTFGSLKSLGQGSKVEGAALEGTLGSAAADSINQRARLDIGALEGRGDLVKASISGGDVVARGVEVSAETLMSSSNTVGGVGAGGLGVGGAFGMTGLYGSTQALLDADSVSANRVDVQARAGNGSAGDAAELTVFAGAAGLVGIGAAVGIANLEQSVTAAVKGDLVASGVGSALTVDAADDSRLGVEATGMAAGAAAAGVVVAKAQRTAKVSALLDAGSSVTGFDNVGFSANSGGMAHARALGAAGGVFAGASAAVALAEDESEVRAGLGQNSEVSGTGGTISISAVASPDVAAEAIGAALAGGLAVGAAVADANARSKVDAYLGDNSILINRGDLDVLAHLDEGSVRAAATAGSGSLYVAGSGASAAATSQNQVNASVGSNALIHGEQFTVDGYTDYARGGDVRVRAVNESSQVATASGLSVAGLLAAGVVKANASSDSSTATHIGDGSVVYASNMVLGANGIDDNSARATAGSGGLIAGNAALATTEGNSTTRLDIGKVMLDIDRLEARALHDTRYAGRADSTSAGVLNASGASVNNAADADVLLQLADQAQVVTSGSLILRTDNNYNSTLGSELAASAAGGGVLTGSASQVKTRLEGDSRIDIGSQTLLRSGLAPTSNDPGALDVVASTRANTDDRAGLTTGGAINVAVVNAQTDANLRNQVNVGSKAALQSNYMLNLGTYASTDIGATALVNTWGVLAAVGKADSAVRINADQQVNVGQDATLESLQNAFVSAGQDGMGGWTSRLTGNAVAQGYSRGLIAIPDASAASTVNSLASTALATGSKLLSGAFVSLGSYGDNVLRNADGAATGYQIGFIPVTVRDSRTGGTTTGDVVVDGRVVAGRYNKLDIVIDSNGNMTRSGGASGDVLPFEYMRDASSAIKQRLNSAGITDFDEVSGQAAYTHMFGDLYAAGGDVILNGRNIRGSGSITANGAPSITITNNSRDNLLLAGDILVPEYSGGNVLFTGVSNQTNGLAVQQNPGQGDALVSIRNNANTGSAAIAVGGDIWVSGGDLNIYNGLGSIQSWGEQVAENITINAPNGEVGYNLGSQNWYGNAVNALWARHSLAYGITNADDAAGYIANVVWGEAAASAGKSLTDYLLYQGSDSSNNNGTGSIMIYGACRYRVGDKDCTLSSLQGQFYDGGVKSKYSYKDTNFLPVVKTRAIRSTYSTEPGDVTAIANGTTPKTGGVTAGSGIKITAAYIDVNVALKAGRPVDYSALIDPGISTWLALVKLNGGTGILDVPTQYVRTTSADSTRIALKYDVANQQFIVPDIHANGGGSIYLDGRIVSTSTAGSLNVVSGKGSVVIDNGLADVGLQLGNIMVGNGAPGQILIRDRELGKASLYLRDGNDTVRGYSSNNVNNQNWDASNVTALNGSALTGYDPRTGMRARWTQRATIRRNIANNDGVFTAENWRWVDGNGNTVYNGQQWNTSGVSYYVDAADQSVFDSKLDGYFAEYRYGTVSYGCEGGKSKESCRFNYGFPGSNKYQTSDGKWRTLWDLEAPRYGSLTVTNTAKADNRIKINFTANDAGLLDVASGQTIRINGVLKNTDGRTSINSRNGDITSTSPDAKIITNDLTLKAAGSIGSIGAALDGLASNPIDVQLVSYTNANGVVVPAGGLRATAGGDVALDVDSDARVQISAGSASQPGNVWLRAKYDLDGLTSNSTSITGGDISLYSTYGRIGSLGSPLQIRAIETQRSDGLLQGGLVTAKAMGDIGLRDLAGDFWVKHIESTAGDVLVDAAAGSLYSATQRGGASFLTEAQLASLRDNMKLLGGGAAQSITSYQSQVDASYAEYFQLRSVGSVVDGQFVANAQAIALYRSLAEAANGPNLDDAAVSAYLAERYARLGEVFSDALGSGWQQETMFAAGFDATYRYQLAANAADSAAVAARKAQLLDAMSSDSTWSEQQLRYVFNANALEPGNGSALNAAPVIIGRNVTLRARDDLGRLDQDYEVSLADVNNGTISADAMLAMRLATTPGDVQMLDANGNVLSADDVRNGAVVVSLRIRSTAPVVVDAKGALDASVGNDAYLHGSSSLNIARLEVGGNARIGSDGDITDVAGGSGTAITVGKDLSLTALRSIVGNDGQPLKVQVNGRLLLANAGGDIGLAQQQGDLRIGIVNGNQDVVLQVGDGSLLSYLKDVTALTGRDVQLLVRDDIRDENGGMLAVRIIAGGELNGSAGGSAHLSSDRDLPVGVLTAGGDLQLLSSTGKVRAASLQAGADLQVTGFTGIEVDTASSGGHASFSAANGSIALDDLRAVSAEINAGHSLSLGDADIDTILKVLALQGASLVDGAQVTVGDEVQMDVGALQMGRGSRISAGRVLEVRSTGDISVGQLAVAGGAAGSVLTLDAAGRIAGNGDVAVNLGGGADVQATLLAGSGIGSIAQPLVVDIGRVDRAHSGAGDIALDLRNGGILGQIQADTGNVHLVSDRDVVAQALLAGADVDLSAAKASVQSVQAGGDVRATTSDQLAVGSLVAQGNATLTAGAGLVLQTAATGGDATLTSAGSTTVGALDADGKVDAKSGAALVATTLRSGAAMTLSSGSTLDVQQLTSGAGLSVDAVGTLSLVEANVGSNATIVGQDDVLLGQATVGQSLAVNAGGALQLDAGNVGGDAKLTSIGDTTIGTLDADGNMDVQSGAALVATSLSSGAAMTLSSGSTLDVQQLTSGADLSADAVGTLSLVEANVGGNADINGQDDVLLGQATVGQSLAVNAGGALQLDIGKVGGDATLTSTGSTTIGALEADGALDAKSGAALVATALSSGAAMTLSSGSTLDVQQLTSGAGLSADAVGTLSLVEANVGGNADINGQDDVVLGQATIGQSLAVNAGGALQLDTGKVGGDATLTSIGDTTIGTLDADGKVDAKSGAALVATTLSSGATMTLSSGSTLDVQQLTSGADLSADAVGNLLLAEANVGGNADINGQDDVVLGQTTVNQSLVVNAGGALQLDTGKVGGDATLTSIGDTTIGTLDADGKLDAKSGAALVATTLSSGAAMTLSSGSTLDVQQLTSGADLSADAVGTLSLVEANVGGNADILGQADVVLGQTTVGQSLAVNAGGALQLDTGKVGGDTTLTSTGSTTIGTLDADGNVDVQSGAALVATTLSSGAAMMLSSGSTLDVQQLTSGADLSADAVGTLSLAEANVGGNADILGQADVMLGQTTVGQSLAVNAGGALQLDTGNVGGDATLSSIGSTTIGTLDADGKVDAKSGAALVATTLSSGAAMMLSSGSTLDVQQLTSGADLSADAVGTLSLAEANVGGNADINGQDDVLLGQTTVGQSLAVNAGGALQLDAGDVGGDATLTSIGSTTVGAFEARGDLLASAGQDIRIDDAIVDGSMTLRAAREIAVGRAQVGVDADWTAGTNLSADAVTTGCEFTGDAGGTLSIGTLQAGCGVQLVSGETLTFDQLQAAHGIALTSRHGDILGDTLDGGRSLQLDAAGDIVIADASAGAALVARSGGSQQWTRYQAGTDVALDAGRDIRIGQGTAGAAHSILAGGSIAFDRLAAGTHAVLDAQGGNLTGGQLQAASAEVGAREHLTLAQALIEGRLGLSASDIQAKVTQTGSVSTPLTTTLTGYRDGVARTVVVEVEPRDAWLIDQLRALDARLTSTSGKVRIDDGYVQNTLALNTPQLNLLMDNTNPRLRPVDIQLLQLNRGFHLAADGRLLDTNAYVVRFKDAFRVISPNYNRDRTDTELDYLGESAVRYMGRMLMQPVDVPAVGTGSSVPGDEERKKDVVEAGMSGAVNLGAPN